MDMQMELHYRHNNSMIHAPAMQRTTRKMPFWNRRIVPHLIIGVCKGNSKCAVEHHTDWQRGDPKKKV